MASIIIELNGPKRSQEPLQRFLYAREKSDPCCAYLFKLFSQLQYIYIIKSLVEKIATAWKNKDTREL